MATFEEWDKFEPIKSNLSPSSLRRRGWTAGAASRDAEVADLYITRAEHNNIVAMKDRVFERELADLRAPMECGHPKACWKPDQRHQLVGDKMQTWDSPVKGHCTVCAETADLRSKIEAARREIYDLRARGANSDVSINALYRGWADRMEAALGKQGEGR